MLDPSLLFILVMAIFIVLIAIVAIAKSKMLNKLFKQLLIGCLSLILFVTSPLLIIPLNLHNDAAFAAGNDPCATPGKDGPATSTGIVNTYFAASAGTLTAGVANTTITLGAQSGAATLVTVGDMLMIIQMQDADINSSNNDTYGDGAANGGDEPPYSPYTNISTPPPSTGASGFTALNNAGRYEYVTATAVSGGGGPGSVVTIKGTGTNKGLNFAYTSAAATGTSGQKSYQIIRVPQYSSLALNSGTTAPAWDGTVGGVFAVDVAGTITFGSGTVLDLWGKGFRGGAGRQLAGTGTTANSRTFYRTVSVPTGNTSADARNGSKGEGVAGTPKYVISYFNPTTLSGTTFNPPTAPTIVTNANEGYPNGSYGRGAPGNAGGGSTDGNNNNVNDMNSGGGGGANGGDGGRGGRAWSSQIASGGYGGKAFSAFGVGTNFDGGRRLFLGGGGGAGTTNDASRSDSRVYTVGGNDYGSPGTNSTLGVSAGIYSSGGAGGGIAVIRANALAGGGGTIDVRGVVGLSTGQDGAGGGGAGGSVYISANSSAPAVVTVNGDGGAGGWATFGDAHGPGGGGGGGAVFRKTPISGNITSSLAGGAGGQTGRTNNTNIYNFFSAGGIGIVGQFDSVDSYGITSSDQCVPQLTVTKTTSTATITKPATGIMTATYKIVVSNAALKSTATNVVISDILPAGFTFSATQPGTPVTLSGGASRATPTNPTTGATTLNWGTFTIPEAESVTLDFNVDIQNIQLLGKYDNPAVATYTDPARTVSNGTTTASYNTAGTGEDVTINGTDYGDAPDTYGTDNTAGNSSSDPVGASHTILSTNNPFIGPIAPDADGTIAPLPYNGTGDDTTNTDDEGLTLPALTSSTDSYTVSLNATNLSASPANLIGWIDFNYNGKFESTEAVTTTVAAGSNNLATSLTWNNIATNSLIPPFAATSQPTFARFRITTDVAITTSTPGGPAANGEVEDYPLSIQGIDYGDAPDLTAGTGIGDYQTTLTNGGASHTILSTLKLGANLPDADKGTLQNATADQDDTTPASPDDEDAFSTFPALSLSTTTYTLSSIPVTNTTASPATLVGWIDFDRDGIFQPDEGVSTTVAVNATTATLTWNNIGSSGPNINAGITYARFRISDGALTTSTPNGAVGNGEVEDYRLTINTVPSLNLVKRITNINGTDITGYVAGTVSAGSNATDLKWPGSSNFSATPQYLRGGIDCTALGTTCNGIKGGKPGDLVEYTIYFLSNGTDNLTNVKICDLIPANTTFEPNTYGSSQGILLGWDSQGSPNTLPDPTNSNAVASIKVFQTNGADGDKGQFIASPTPLTSPPCSTTTNTNGAVVVNVVSGATTVPIATGSGVPINSYGFVRFKVKVN